MRRGRATIQAAEAAAFAVLLAGGVEVFSLPAGSSLWGPVAVLGLWSLLAPVMALVLAGAAWSLGQEGTSRSRDEGDSQVGPPYLFLGVWLGMIGAALLLFSKGQHIIIGSIRAERLLPGLTTAFGAGVLVAVGLVGRRISQWIVVRFGDGRSLGPLRGGLCLAVGAVPVVLAVWPAFEAVSMMLPTAALVSAVCGLVAGLTVRAMAWRPHRFRTPTLVGSALVFALVGTSAYSGDADVRTAVEVAKGVAHPVAMTLQKLSDGDGDGFSGRLGGGDCDDGRPDVHPLAAEIPDNGVDEDCDGVDLRLGDVPPAGQNQYYALGKALDRPWNFLFVTVEATRADHLSIHGYTRETSPNLARLAANGLVFDRAYSPSNATRYSIPTTFTGRYLADVDIDWLGSYLIVQPGAETIFQRLQGAGWYTEALLPAQQLDGMWHGMERGFDAYVPLEKARLKATSAPAINAALKRTLTRLAGAQGAKRWAIWTHYLEPHEPYRQHPEHDFGGKSIDRYDSEIAAFDGALGEILETLETLGLRQRTVIVVTADHGEEFGEHGRHYHGHQLYDESLRVPLLIHVPGAKPVRVKAPVSTIDVAPTVANLAGLAPDADGGGRSQLGRLTGVVAKDDWTRTVFAESIADPQRPNQRIVTMVRWPHKVISNLRTKNRQVFDLAADPGEKAPLPATAKGIRKGMLDLLKTELRRQKAVRLKRVVSRRVMDAPPAVAGDQVQRVSPHLEFLGGRLSKRRIGDRVYQQVQTWFRALGAKGARPDLEIRFAVVDASGKTIRWFKQRPLTGVYPMGAWQPGEVVELAQLLRVSREVGEVRVEMSLYRAKKRVFGPHPLGAIVHDLVAPK